LKRECHVTCISKYVEIKCQLDAIEVFIADLIACSTCFGHHYAHHQELKSIIHHSRRTFSQRDVSLGEETSGNRWARGPDCTADGPMYPTFTFCIEKSYDGTHLAFGGTLDRRCHFKHVSLKQSRFYHCQTSTAHK